MGTAYELEALRAPSPGLLCVTGSEFIPGLILLVSSPLFMTQ